MGDVQKELGIASASSFVVQVKNPLAPASGPQPVRGKGASYPDWLMQSVFGTAGEGETESARGREEYGLRFASCETPELLDYLNAQLLMIAARSGEEGLEQSLGEGRGEGLYLHFPIASLQYIDIVPSPQQSRRRRKQPKY